MKDELKIGLFGFGCVGSGLYQVLNQSDLLSASIKKIVVKNKNKKREIDASHLSFERNDILCDPEINLVVELIDDAEAAYEIVTTAFRNGKNVVSANKKLIAEHIDELLQLKDEYNVSFLYEAAVCGSIPVIRNLEEYYNNDSLTSIQGICNGTTNYILTRLNNELKEFDEILNDAQDLGFAETDPTLDIDGFDSKFKLQILILHTFGLKTKPSDVLNIGIRHIKSNDILYAKEKGLKLRLISFARKIENEVVAFAAPMFVRDDSFAFDINNEFNGVSIEALLSDNQVFIGKGAGSFPTASAVLSDVSAMQFKYQYEYRKLKNSKCSLLADFELKVFVSSNDSENLSKIRFNGVEEEFTSLYYSYKVGRLNISDLTHEFYRENPNLFISFFEDSKIFTKTELLKFKELAIN